MKMRPRKDAKAGETNRGRIGDAPLPQGRDGGGRIGDASLPTGGVRHLVAATANSLRGLRDALHETAFRQECAAGVVHCAALCLVPMDVAFRLALAAAGAAVLAAELLNTAVEAVVDLASPGWHPLARKAKDAASASVFVLLVLTLALWCAALVSAFA